MPKPVKSQPSTIRITWRPQPRQLTAIRSCGLGHPFDGGVPSNPSARVIGYGGAAGGGKTDTLLGIAMIAGFTWPGINIGYFRREYPQLEGLGGAIPRSRELMTSWAKYSGDNHRWAFPNGTNMQFCHCKDEDSVYNYQSQQFDIILIDEATQFTRFQYRYLLTRNRATKPGVTPFMVLATNPGNVGHAWFLTEFVNSGPWESVNDVEVEPGYIEKHIFIPAKLSDNAILEKRDPGYRATLMAQPEITRKQLLDGDWTAFAGQYFKSWRRDVHVIKPIDIPPHWKRFRSLDYGLDMTACYWWAVNQSGQCHIYRELYQPNLNLSEAARKIVHMTPKDEKIDYTVASPDLWNRRQDSGISGVETLIQHGLTGLCKADNRRVAGWLQLREFIEPYKNEFGETSASILVWENCLNLIRTLPTLLHDAHNPDDVSDKCEDHAPESIRYGCMSRPRPNIVRINQLDQLAERLGESSPEYRIWSRLLHGSKRAGSLNDIPGF